jgi:hypothetical protein
MEEAFYIGYLKFKTDLICLGSWYLPFTPAEVGNIVCGIFTPVLAKRTKTFDTGAAGVDRTSSPCGTTGRDLAVELDRGRGSETDHLRCVGRR